MSWVRFDDGYPDHPKMVFAGKAGRELHTAAIFYCAKALTDGVIHINQLRKLAASEEIDGWKEALALLTQTVPGFDSPSMIDSGDGWYQIHDYLDYQPSKAQVEAARDKTSEARAEAGRAGGFAKARARAGRDSQQNGSEAPANEQLMSSKDEANGQQNPSKTLANSWQNCSPVPDPVPDNPYSDPEPDPEPSAANAANAGADEGGGGGGGARGKASPPKHRPAEFKAFYASYPRADDPADAARAWDSVKPDEAEIELIGLCLVRFGGRRLPNDLASRCKAPAAWLRARRWESTDPFPGLTIAGSEPTRSLALAGTAGKGYSGLGQSADEIQGYMDQRDGRAA